MHAQWHSRSHWNGNNLKKQWNHIWMHLGVLLWNTHTSGRMAGISPPTGSRFAMLSSVELFSKHAFSECLHWVNIYVPFCLPKRNASHWIRWIYAVFVFVCYCWLLHLTPMVIDSVRCRTWLVCAYLWACGARDLPRCIQWWEMMSFGEDSSDSLLRGSAHAHLQICSWRRFRHRIKISSV